MTPSSHPGTAGAACCWGVMAVMALAAASDARAQGVSLRQVFSREAFHRPVHLTYVPDGSGRIVVVEQAGLVKWFRPESERAEGILIDLRSLVSTSHNEEGLLSVAFHPRFAENQQAFFYYSASMPRRSVIARYWIRPEPFSAEPSSARIVMEVAQPYGNHNGGQLAFGPDGYLYIGLGDGGSAGDPLGHGQNRATLLGSILRIDVDRPSGGLAYGIPQDNPFAASTDGSRPEIWAYGLRNPWRFSFDRLTGALFAGDVGQNTLEEVDRIEKGGNYGWNIMEGTRCYSPPEGCDREGLRLPISEYGRRLGISVTGGFVYRGKAIPGLAGRYVFGDFGSGMIWSIPSDAKPTVEPESLLKTRIYISSFGEDADGELYVCDLEGKVFRLVSAR